MNFLCLLNMLKCYVKLVASKIFLHHSKEKLFFFNIISFVKGFMQYTSQDPAKYQEGAKNNHWFLHSKDVIG